MFNNYTAQVTTTTYYSVYLYKSKNVVIAYSVAFGVAALAVVAEFSSYFANNQVSSLSCNLSISAILCATRNTMLDNLVKQHSLRPLVVGYGIHDVKLRYGMLQNLQGEGIDSTVATELNDVNSGLITGLGLLGQLIEDAKGYRMLHTINSNTK